MLCDIATEIYVIDVQDDKLTMKKSMCVIL